MLGRSHVTTGICVGLLALSSDASVFQLEPLHQGLFLLAVGVGSLLPDIDHPQSIISRQIILVGGIVGRLVQHRGFFHSILGTALLFYLLWLARLPLATASNATGVTSELVWLGLLMGYVNHIVGDVLTVSGVKLFYPVGWKVRIPLMVTNSFMETLFVALVMSGTLGIIYFGSSFV